MSGMLFADRWVKSGRWDGDKPQLRSSGKGSPCWDVIFCSFCLVDLGGPLRTHLWVHLRRKYKYQAGLGQVLCEAQAARGDGSNFLHLRKAN